MTELVIWPPSGRYILAVSGGADSMVLLDAFAHSASDRGYELIVAHFDHGLRPESAADAKFVAAAAATHKLPFELHAAALGTASEAQARAARHDWLEQIRTTHNAAAILTAHHQDDLLETSLLNLARGSGRLGLAPLLSRPTILRPLLQLSRPQLRDYAREHNVQWREDPTNADLSNPRNLLRHRLLPAATPEWRTSYLALVTELSALNAHINHDLHEFTSQHRTDGHSFTFPSASFKDLTDAQTGEIILAAARALVPGIQLDRRLILEAARFAKSGRSGTHRPLRQNILVVLKKAHITITTNGLS